MRKLTAMVVAAVALSVALAAAVAIADEIGPNYSGKLDDHKRVCMIQDTVQTKDGLEYSYNGKNYYLCCRGCLAGFQKNPAKYSHATDPVNGKSVDKAEAPIYAHKGHAYFFSSRDTLATFAKDPEKYVRHAKSTR